MAKTVGSVSAHVNGVTAAVATMEAAVIAVERKAAETICANVDNGFYVMIKSQISQKAVAAYTEMTTKQMILLQLVKALENVKRQMESDYAMICRRYTKLFGALNKALETRIREIDRPAMKLAEIRASMIFDKLKDNGSLLFECSGEVSSLEQTACAAKIKQKTRDVLQTLSESAAEKESYNKKVESILLPEKTAVDDEASGALTAGTFCHLPAVFCASASLVNAEETRETVYIAQKDGWLNTTPASSEIGLKSGALNWEAPEDTEAAFVRKEFAALCETEAEDKRLIAEIMRLFDASQWEEAKA
ncbi:MAG: hypothetical protein LBC77_01470 [Spirochaetaceae bacterium]|nr:hypothetical protein [Spirochaetaceae bacterium]